jgi:HD-GYP domain-containing protein (c-di-GMP phosphodiesterase class II)
MIKKISVSKLKFGMYISGFDRPWLHTPFLFNRLFVKDDKQIEKVRKYCNHVYIDTDKGLDSEDSTPVTKADEKIEHEMKETVQEALKREPPPIDTVDFNKEIKEAKKVHQETKEVIKDIMNDIKMGKSITSENTRRVVDNITDSIIRNRDALLCLTQLKSKDEYTSFHSINVCILCLAFGRHMGYKKGALMNLGIGGLLHDIGKMKVPLEILNKPGPLTEKEFEEMKKHTTYGAEILSKTHGFSHETLEVPLQHHERYDGSGYPKGLKGEQIGVFGLFSAISDVYDAITSNRVYHNAILPHDALKRMFEWRGRDFHPTVMERFIQCVGIYPFGTLVELNDSTIGIIISINRVQILRPKILLIIDEKGKPYGEQKVIDLNERPSDGKDYTWSIKKILDPANYHIDVKQHLKGTGLLYDITK